MNVTDFLVRYGCWRDDSPEYLTTEAPILTVSKGDRLTAAEGVRLVVTERP